MSNLTRGQLEALIDLSLSRIDEVVLVHTGKIWRRGCKYEGCCPVHGGDNTHAFNLFTDGHTVVGNWLCNTRQCQFHFKRDFLGFVRGFLSHLRHNWSSPGDREVSFGDAVNYLLDTLKVPVQQLVVDEEAREKKNFVGRANALWGFQDRPKQEGWSRQEMLKRLEIPAQYYLDRGYSPEVLIRFDVGMSRAAASSNSHRLKNRVVVPIHDQSGKRIVSYTARTIFPLCPKCGCYHAPDAGCVLDPVAKNRHSKWDNADNFSRADYLYNWHSALPHIRRTKRVILVEGPGDVWRAIEAGVENVVAVFGINLTDGQQALLDCSGAMEVVVLLDNDKAGVAGADILRQQLGRSYRLFFPKYSAKDVGELKPDVIKWLLSQCDS